MAVSYNSDYWKWQEGEESKVESNGNICYETGCENLSNMGWCVPCRQKEAAEHQAQRAYKQGSYRYSQWYEVQQELLAAQQQLIQAFTNMQLFNIELERLTGVRGQFS